MKVLLPEELAGDSPMTGTYIAVVVVEAAIIALLFLVGWIFS